MSLKDVDVTETECNCGYLFTTIIDIGINGRKVLVHICKKDKQRILDAINEEFGNKKE